MTMRMAANRSVDSCHALVAIAQLLKMPVFAGPNIGGFDRNPSSAAAYVGAVGALLEQGLLAEARGFDPED